MIELSQSESEEDELKTSNLMRTGEDGTKHGKDSDKRRVVGENEAIDETATDDRNDVHPSFISQPLIQTLAIYRMSANEREQCLDRSRNI